MDRLLIIADDFTGALDTGVQFSHMGITTQVFLHKDMDWDNIGKNVQVLVVDTQSRHIEPPEAYKRVYHLCHEAGKRGVKFFYKKTDSTLRGNIGSEMAALMDACKIERLPFIPAYPKAGRTTKDGNQYVDGIPLHRTVFAGDPLNPIQASYIPGLIKGQTDKEIHVIKTSHISRELSMDEGKGIFVFDAMKEENLIQISHKLTRRQDIMGVAGCAGFAPYLPRIFNLKPEIKEIGIGDSLHRPILAVCGSVNQMSMSQVAYAERQGIKSQVISPHKLVHDDYLNSPDYETKVEKTVQALMDHGCFILKTATEKGDIIPLRGHGDGPGGGSTYRMITELIGSLVRDIMKRIDIETLIVFGGDTALGIVEKLHCTAIIPKTELLTGIPLSTLESTLFKGNLVTKAGGFGNESTLMDIIEQRINCRKEGI
ncbi:MAG: four-carbon acid sugar kinase family protein [Clostridiales bacterium]|nr:four-carbon acid sugar kinase family protein [Clostridiales bacterium]